jgi:hypothetical protein
MTMHGLYTRLERLEQHAQGQEEGLLYVWRLPEESAAEACARYEVDPEDFPVVRIHVWPGNQVSARLATPPAPVWMAQPPPGIADLEHRLHEGMNHGGLHL